MRNLIGTSVLCGLLFGGLALVQAAFAADSRYDGRDPRASGCASGAVAPGDQRSAQITGYAYVRFRHASPRCRADWAEVLITDGRPRQIQVWIEDHAGRRYGFRSAITVQGWSAMKAAAGADLRACGRVGGLTACSGWYR